MSNIILPNPELKYDCSTGVFILIKDYVTPEIVVPAGQVTDGASRPEWASLFIEKYDKHLPACIVHDYMYRKAIGTKKEADKLFETNLKRCVSAFGLDPDLVKPMYTAVKLFGKGKY